MVEILVMLLAIVMVEVVATVVVHGCDGDDGYGVVALVKERVKMV